MALRNLWELGQAAGKLARIRRSTRLPQDVLQELVATMKTISEKDLKIDGIQYSNCITHTMVGRSPDCEMFFFCIPEGLYIPLHDHPSMTVLCKAFHGTLTLPSYTIQSKESGIVKASRQIRYLRPNEVCLVSPQEWNIHEVRAESQSAVLFDVSIPPYNDREGRSGVYYSQHEVDGTHHKLIEIPCPTDFYTPARMIEGFPL